jgi:hypothetical protein
MWYFGSKKKSVLVPIKGILEQQASKKDNLKTQKF